MVRPIQPARSRASLSRHEATDFPSLNSAVGAALAGAREARFTFVNGHPLVMLVTLLAAPDEYWHGNLGSDFRPALRITLDDAARTWVHIDPATGTRLGATNSSGRTYRWLFAALHDLDPPSSSPTGFCANRGCGCFWSWASSCRRAVSPSAGADCVAVRRYPPDVSEALPPARCHLGVRRELIYGRIEDRARARPSDRAGAPQGA